MEPLPGIHWFGPGGSGVAYPQPIRNPVGLGGYHPAPLPPGFRQPVGVGGIPRPGITPAGHMHGLIRAHANRQAAARAALRVRPRFF